MPQNRKNTPPTPTTIATSDDQEPVGVRLAEERRRARRTTHADDHDDDERGDDAQDRGRGRQREPPRSAPRPAPDRRSSRSRRGHPIPVDGQEERPRRGRSLLPSPTRIRVAMTSASSSRCRPGSRRASRARPSCTSTMPVQKLPDPTAAGIRSEASNRAVPSFSAVRQDHRRVGEDRGSRSSPVPTLTFGEIRDDATTPPIAHWTSLGHEPRRGSP